MCESCANACCSPRPLLIRRCASRSSCMCGRTPACMVQPKYTADTRVTVQLCIPVRSSTSPSGTRTSLSCGACPWPRPQTWRPQLLLPPAARQPSGCKPEQTVLGAQQWHGWVQLALIVTLALAAVRGPQCACRAQPPKCGCRAEPGRLLEAAVAPSPGLSRSPRVQGSLRHRSGGVGPRGASGPLGRAGEGCSLRRRCAPTGPAAQIGR